MTRRQGWVKGRGRGATAYKSNSFNNCQRDGAHYHEYFARLCQFPAGSISQEGGSNKGVFCGQGTSYSSHRQNISILIQLLLDFEQILFKSTYRLIRRTSRLKMYLVFCF